VLGPRGGVITTATLRDATGWDALVTELGQPGLVRHGLRHTALTWMADAGIDLHILQRVAGHQDPAVTARYLHPQGSEHRRSTGASCGCSSAPVGDPVLFSETERFRPVIHNNLKGRIVAGCYRRRQECRLNTGPTRSDWMDRFGRAGEI